MAKTGKDDKQYGIVPALRATLWMSDKSYAICINPTPVPLTFAWIGRKLFASDQRQVIFPADDEPMHDALVDRLMASMKRDPESVFVCEVAPWGPFQEHATTAPVVGTKQALTGFARIKKFFSADDAVTVVAPPKALQPVSNAEVFINRFANSARNLTVGALLVTQLAGAFAGPLHQHGNVTPAGDKPVAMQMIQETPAGQYKSIAAEFGIEKRPDYDSTQLSDVASDMAEISAAYLKYAGHGKTGVETILSGVTVADSGDFVGRAFVNKSQKKCHIAELRVDYSEILAGIAPNTKWNDPAIRKVLIAHEDMHCRISPYLVASTYKSHDQQAAKKAGKKWELSGEIVGGYYTNHADESISDAMAILIIARHDGIAEAKTTMTKMLALRADEGPDHDTRETLKLISAIIDNHPEKFASDALAFQTAIEIGLIGSAKSFVQHASKEELALMHSEGFMATMMHNMTGLSQAVEQYTQGKYAPSDAAIWMYGYSQSVSAVSVAPSKTQALTEKGIPSINAVMKSASEAYQHLMVSATAFKNESTQANVAPKAVRKNNPAPAQAKSAATVPVVTATPSLPSLSRMDEPGAAIRMLRQQNRQEVQDMTQVEDMDTDAPGR